MIVIGAGGQGLVVMDALLARQADGDPIVVVGCFDDDRGTHGRSLLDVPVVGATTALATVPHEAVVVALGDNRQRATLSDRLVQTGETLLAVIHPTAALGRGVRPGAGAMILARATVVVGAEIGRGALVNTASIVEHHAVIEEFAHISPGATIGADVRIGARTLVGMGATVLSGVTIGCDTIVGAGAVVVRDLPDGVVAVGIPAKVRRDPRGGPQAPAR